MNCELFQRLACQSNKYARDSTRQGNSNLFFVRKCKNVSVVEIAFYLGSC